MSKKSVDSFSGAVVYSATVDASVVDSASVDAPVVDSDSVSATVADSASAGASLVAAVVDSAVDSTDEAISVFASTFA